MSPQFLDLALGADYIVAVGKVSLSMVADDWMSRSVNSCMSKTRRSSRCVATTLIQWRWRSSLGGVRRPSDEAPGTGWEGTIDAPANK